MEAMDQYTPSNPYTNDGYTTETGWDAYHPAENASVSTPDEAPPVPMPSVLPHTESAFGSVTESAVPNRSRQLAQELAGTLQKLSEALDDSEAERQRMEEDRTRVEEQIRALEAHRADKDRFTQTLRGGAGGSLTSEDLQSIGTMMDSLKQDPDRLTVLFSVVQHASQLASIVSDYSQLRRLADGS